jgi:AraC-like DNA-binding protein
MEQLYPLFFSNEIGLLEEVLAGFRTAKIHEPDSEVARDCRMIADLPEAQSALVQRTQLLRITAALLAEEFKRVQSQRSGQNWGEDHMIQIFEKLSSAELLNLSVDELAAKFSCSRRHLNRLFHQHFHLSITSLRMEIRLLKAVSLLRNPQAKVINVAEQCGFNHLGLFNTCFKRRFGVSPGQWRKSASAEHGQASKSNPTDKSASPLQNNKMFSGDPSSEAAAKPNYDGTAADLMAGLVESKLSGAGDVSVFAKAKQPNPAVQPRHDG